MTISRSCAEDKLTQTGHSNKREGEKTILTRFVASVEHKRVKSVEIARNYVATSILCPNFTQLLPQKEAFFRSHVEGVVADTVYFIDGFECRERGIQYANDLASAIEWWKS